MVEHPYSKVKKIKSKNGSDKILLDTDGKLEKVTVPYSPTNEVDPNNSSLTAIPSNGSEPFLVTEDTATEDDIPKSMC